MRLLSVQQLRRSLLDMRLRRGHGVLLSLATHTPGYGRFLSLDLEQRLRIEEQAAAVEETEDIKELGNLLKTVKTRANPSYKSAIPVHGSIPWAQALLDQSRATPDVTSARQQSLDLLPRSMHDSYTEISLPLASDPQLFEQYTNASGGVRTGKLFEHLDSLAGSISYKHVLGPDVETLGKISERGFYIVTAAVDRLDMLAPVQPVRDLRLSGHVIHVGSSSMEVAVDMSAIKEDGSDETVLLGRFAMVCRDAYTHKAHPVNKLLLSTPEEQALWEMGELNKRRRQSQAQSSLRLVPPTSSEAEALHTFELRYARDNMNKVPDAENERIWMEDTRQQSTMIMFPQERNVHQKIFGGFLMRQAYELGFTTACLFTRRHVHFTSLDKISFARPVPIGSILRLKSEILHNTSRGPPVVHVRVTATVVEVETGDEKLTNDFRFTWSCTDDSDLRRIAVPKTYREAMKWLEGRRALEIGAAIRRLRG